MYEKLLKQYALSQLWLICFCGSMCSNESSDLEKKEIWFTSAGQYLCMCWLMRKYILCMSWVGKYILRMCGFTTLDFRCKSFLLMDIAASMLMRMVFIGIRLIVYWYSSIAKCRERFSESKGFKIFFTLFLRNNMLLKHALVVSCKSAKMR